MNTPSANITRAQRHAFARIVQDIQKDSPDPAHSPLPVQITALLTRMHGHTVPDETTLRELLAGALVVGPWCSAAFQAQRDEYLCSKSRLWELERGIVLQIVAYASALAHTMPWPDFDRARSELGEQRFPLVQDPEIEHRRGANLLVLCESIAAKHTLTDLLPTLIALSDNAPTIEHTDSHNAWCTAVLAVLDRLSQLDPPAAMNVQEQMDALEGLLRIEPGIRYEAEVSKRWRSTTEGYIRALRETLETRTAEHPMLAARHERVSLELKYSHNNISILRAAALVLQTWATELALPSA